MILTCPACSAKYMISSDSLGGAGRDVRCAKCGHQWHQSPPKDSLDDLISRIKEQEVEEVSFRESTGYSDKHQPQATKLSLLDRVKRTIFKPRKTTSLLYGKLGLLQGLISKPKNFAGILVSFSIFLVFCFLLITVRGPLAHHFPPALKVYEAAGFSIAKPEPSKPLDKIFSIDRPLIEESEDGGRVLMGGLINITSDEVKLPDLMIRFLDKDGQVIHEEKVELHTKSLAKESTYDLNIPLNYKIPETIEKVIIVMMEAAQAPEGHSEEQPEKHGKG